MKFFFFAIFVKQINRKISMSSSMRALVHICVVEPVSFFWRLIFTKIVQWEWKSNLEKNRDR